MLSNFLRVGVAFGLIATSALVAQSDVGQLAVEGQAEVKTWVQPVYPDELRTNKVKGEVVVHFVVDHLGKVSQPRIAKSTDARFDAAVLEALPKWEFEPAVSGGVKVPMGMKMRWIFSLPYREPGFLPPSESTPEPLPRTPAIPEFTPDPVYPVGLEPKRLNGEVVTEIGIGTDGSVTDIALLAVTHADLVAPSLSALRSWKFKPSMQGDVPMIDRKRVPLSFHFDPTVFTEKSQLEANGMSIEVPEGMSEKAVCDRLPEIITTVDPVYPLQLLSESSEGNVEVTFTINPSGAPEGVRVSKESAPGIGAAVVAAIESTRFSPALLDGQAVAVRMIKKHTFALPMEKTEEPVDSNTRLLLMIKQGQTIASAKGLDGKLKPVWRVGPVYPASLQAENPKGRAEIEFVIDSTGRARVPKVLNATHPEFGWAAATAVSLWTFEPPTRNGEPTDVRVRIPMEFAPN